MIHFEVYQALSFTLLASFVVSLTLTFFAWLTRELFRKHRKPKL